MSDNIFLSLAHRRTAGIIREFVLWCIVCFAAVLSLVAAVIGEGNVTWIMLMVLSIGLGVIMVFRLTPIALLYSSCAFCLTVFIVHYINFSRALPYHDFSDVSYSALNLVLFVLLILVSVALVVCEFVHFFTRYNLRMAILILVITDAVMTLILQILMFAAGYIGSNAYANKYLREALNERGYWIGTIGLWTVLTVCVLFHIFFFRGMINPRKGKIINGYKKSVSMSGMYGVRGIRGMYTGQIFSLNNGTITMGSGSGVGVVIQDSHVSRQHCIVRFNHSTNFYEIFDNSSNGVYVSSGARLQKGVYNAVKRGEIICIGSMAQQFQLL